MGTKKGKKREEATWMSTERREKIKGKKKKEGRGEGKGKRKRGRKKGGR